MSKNNLSGIDGQEFTIKLTIWGLSISGLIVGEDILLSEPVPKEDEWCYTITPVSDYAKTIFKSKN